MNIQTENHDTPEVRGKPARRLHLIIGTVVSAMLIAAIFYGGNYAPKPDEGADDKQGTPAATPPSAEEIRKVIEEQFKDAEKRREIANVAPGIDLRTKDLPPELYRTDANKMPTGDAAVAEIERAQRQELIAAAPIIVQSAGGPTATSSATKDIDQFTKMLNQPPASLASERYKAEIEKRLQPQNGLVDAIAKAGLGATQKTKAEADRDWLDRQADTESREPPIQLERAVSRYVIHQGTIVPAVLVTEVNSDLPGTLTARTAEDIFDTIDGRYLLIPKGSRVVGVYNNAMSPGQRRVLIAFNRIIFPSGDSIRLPGMEGVDMAGRAGFDDKVNNHFLKVFGTSFLTAGIARWVERDSSNVNIYGGSGASVMSGAAGQALLDTNRAILERNRNIAPTATIRQGFQFNIMVSRDLALEAYGR